MACGAWASGYVRSMTGVTFPASMSSVRTSRSSWFSLEMNVVSFWPTNGDSTQRTELAIGAAEPPAAGLAPGDDERPLRGEGAPEAGQ